MAHGRKNLISFMANRKRALPEGCQEQERKKSRVESGTSAGHSGCLQVPETEEVPKLELLAQAVIVGEVVGSLTCTSVPFGFWKALPFFRTHESDPFYLFATGMCFWHGQGCSVNYETAALLWTKAADKGYIPAQYALGMCYWNGTGVKRDDRKAVALFHESSQFSLSQTMLGTFYQIQRKKAETNQWLSAAAIQDDPEAQYKLGLCYETGFFSEQDLKLAFFWYKKAAKQGHRAAQTCVGGCYFYGKGVPTDSEQSFEWNMKSALQGSGTSLYNVGMAYMDKKDYEKSREFFKKSVDAGYPFGSAGLGKLHYLGKGGFHVNLEEAEKLYSAAAANVSKSEYYHCGWICIDLANIFLKKNPPEVENSVRWYLKARKMNDKFTAASFLAKPSKFARPQMMF
jgi:TPR repeat protein